VCQSRSDCRDDSANQSAKTSDANGRPLSFFITAGQISDYTGAAALLDDLSKAPGCWHTGAMMPRGNAI
jgi:hypothetical protein